MLRGAKIVWPDFESERYEQPDHPTSKSFILSCSEIPFSATAKPLLARILLILNHTRQRTIQSGDSESRTHAIVGMLEDTRMRTVTRKGKRL